MDPYDERIASDLYRHHGDVSARSFSTDPLTNPAFRSSDCLREASKYAEYKVKVSSCFRRGLRSILKSVTHLHIDHRTSIGDGLHIDYAEVGTIVPEAVIGNNPTIDHGAVIGQTNRGNRMGVPTIGNNVRIGAHAVVVGNATIGDTVLIAPLSTRASTSPRTRSWPAPPGRASRTRGPRGT